MRPVYLPADGAFLRYIEVPGDDPPLLWLHGWQCSSTGELMPAAIQPPLRGRRSLLIDFLGHGYSDKPRDFGYGLEDHARTIVDPVDALGLGDCGLVGHSMGGAVAILVAAARPAVVSLLVMAEGNLEPEGDDGLDGQSEGQFVERGFRDLLDARSRKRSRTRTVSGRPTWASPGSWSLARSTARPFRWRSRPPLLFDRSWPASTSHAGICSADSAIRSPSSSRRWQAIGVGWKVVPETGHAMGLQNPLGLAQAVAEVLPAAWAR